MRRIRMDRTGISGTLQRIDCALRGESSASGEIDWNAGTSRNDDFGFVPRGCKVRRTGRAITQDTFVKILAFLPSLVPAPVLSFLLRRDGQTDAPRQSRMGGREAHSVRPLAHRRESRALARTPDASRPDRVHGVLLLHIFYLPADSRRNSLLPA